MPADGPDENVRRSVVPQAAGRSLWLAAVWTGAGAALVGAVISIVAVAVCWLPASAGHGNAGSAIRAGVLTFLAALHGGITLDGLDAAFLPLGMTVAAGVIAWRAGAGLADAANDLDEFDTARLVRAGALQVAAFVVLCGIGAEGATLGTSSVSIIGAVLAGAVLFAATGSVSFVRSTALADEVADRAPAWLAPAVRIAAAVAAVQIAAGALLVAGSLIAHHAQVEALSREVGGGWSGVPVLLLGILAGPNAAIAGASYLGGPGFALGSGTTVALGSSPRGTVPAFPVLGAMPSGPAPWAVWLLAVATPIAAGCCVAAIARSGVTWGERWIAAAAGVGSAGLGAFVLAWQGGGSIGSGRLHAVGASPWQFGLVVLTGSGIAGALVLGAQAGLEHLREQEAADVEFGRDSGRLAGLKTTLTAVAAAAASTARGEEEVEADPDAPDLAPDGTPQGTPEGAPDGTADGALHGDGGKDKKLAG